MIGQIIMKFLNEYDKANYYEVIEFIQKTTTAGKYWMKVWFASVFNY